MRSVVAIGLLLCATAAGARVYTVNAGDASGLVRAIEQSNASPGADIIHLEAGWYVLHHAHDQTTNAGLPTVRGELKIIGNGSELRRYSDAQFRLLSVGRGAHVIIDQLSFAEGALGALSNRGRVDCRRCRFMDNVDRRGQGIIENFGEMSLHQTEIGFNDLGIARGEAGIVVNYGTLQIRDSAFLGNSLARRFHKTTLANGVLNYGEARLSNVRLYDNRVAFDYSDEAVAAVVNLGNGEVEMRDVSDDWLITAQ